MFKRCILVVRQKLSSEVRGYWSITRVWKMAGRSDRFGSSEIIIIFGECLERGALKRHSPSPITLCSICATREVSPEALDRLSHGLNKLDIF